MDEATAEVVDITPTPEETEAKSWQEEAGIENPRFNDFKSPADLAKSYTELERMQTNHVRFPSEDAGEEDVQKFNDKMVERGYYKMPTDPDAQRDVLKLMGTPAEPSGYELPEIEGIELDAETEGEFKKVAHEAGLTVDQAKAVHTWLGSNLAADAQDTAKRAEEGMAELKGEWGQAFEHKLEANRNTVAMLEKKVPGLSNYFDQMAENGYDANMVRLMDAVTEVFGETGTAKYEPRTTLTREEARARISEVQNNPKHPANPANSDQRGYEQARADFMELYKIAHS